MGRLATFTYSFVIDTSFGFIKVCNWYNNTRKIRFLGASRQMANYWYALHSHPHKEDQLWQQVIARGIGGFYPRVKVNPVNPRARKVRPYFPGYLFVNADIEAVGLSLFQWMPFSTGLVTFSGEPAVVPDPLIIALQERIDSINRAGGVKLNGLKAGDEVVIESGPFEGYEAIFDLRLPGSERVRVLLKMLNDRIIQVEILGGQIRKKNQTV
jgi:transcription antitermination factor NusG